MQDSIYHLSYIQVHLFSISFYWVRKENGKFKNKVYVLLQKQKPELYNITGIIELLEERFGLESACNISILLCLGENDFLPKYQGISHEKWISTVIDTTGTLTKFGKIYQRIWETNQWKLKRRDLPQHCQKTLLSLQSST